MKKQLLALGLLSLAALQTQAQTTVTVPVGPNYADQKWYSLDNGIQATQSKDNWDLAFEITGYSSTILANTQKTGFAAYKAPYKIADFATIDTTGISNWPMLYNSDANWETGAFNRGANPGNPSDLGWGVYDMNTHFVTGDSCYVIKVNPTTYKKIKFVSLASGSYNFEYADINGANSQTVALNKSTYTGKNFAYFNLATNAAVDREPAAASWDLTFVKYHAFIPVAYPVTGVLSNKNVLIAQADDITNASAYTNFTAHAFSNNISTIGHDWKSFDLNNNVWRIVGDTVYFIKDRSGSIWKVRMTGFGGSSNGNMIFTQEKLSAVGIADVDANPVSQVAVYPNPANESASLLFASEKATSVSVSIIDLNGREVSAEIVNVTPGFNTYGLNTGALTSGVYFIRLNAGSYTTTQKLIRN